MKGQLSSTMILYVIKFGVLAVIIFLLKFIAPLVHATVINTNELEQQMFVNQLLTSPQGILKFEGYPQFGVIDITKFPDLDKRISYNQRLAAHIVLMNLTGEKVIENYFQKDIYNLWSVLVGKRGAGGTIKYENNYYTLYSIGDVLVPAKLSIEVLMQNE